MTTQGKKIGTFDDNFINSIESIFDAHFLISKENIINDYRIKDEDINLLFGKENLQGKNFIEIFATYIEQEKENEFTTTILEKKSRIIEISLLIRGNLFQITAKKIQKSS